MYEYDGKVTTSDTIMDAYTTWISTAISSWSTWVTSLRPRAMSVAAPRNHHCHFHLLGDRMKEGKTDV